MNKFTIQKSFAISAGAGSGKTYTLSRRYINAILGFDFFREDNSQDNHIKNLKAATVDEIVTMTYTEAAALEMKERIFALMVKVLQFQSLDKKDSDYSSIKVGFESLEKENQAYVQDTLQIALESSGDARISTIHAYCLNVLKKYADIAKLDSKVDMIKDDEKANLIGEIIFNVLNAEGNKEVVLELSESINMFLFDGLIKKYLNESKFRYNFESFSLESMSVELYKDLIKELYPLDDVSESLTNAKEYLRAHVDGSAQYSDMLDRYCQGFLDFDALSWTECSKEFEVTIAFNRKPFTQHKGEFKEYVEDIKGLEAFVSAYSRIDAQKEKHFFTLLEKVKTLLQKIKSMYDAELKAMNKLDFDTIITATLPIVEKVSSSIKYFMVDEFQDTNELQYKIVNASCSKETNLFVVGDSKQSIYSFQGAEIEVFNDAVGDTKRFEYCADMSENHRSDGVVLDNVNRIFEKILVHSDHLQLIKQNYEATPQALTPFKASRKEQGSFKFLITPQTYEMKQDEDNDISEYATIAKLIENISTGKLKEYDVIKEKIDVKQKAIVIVFDAKSKMLELKSYLNKHGIECKVSASENFYHTKEISDIFHMLKAIEILTRNKQNFSNTDNFYLVGAMRSNILRLSDNDVSGHIKAKTQPEQLKAYVKMAKQVTLAELVKYIYDDARVNDVYAHLSDVDQRVGNLYKFLELALDYETNHGDDLYSFVSLLEKSVYFSDVDEDEAFYKSENVESIELCTIHSTKGLAYPMVILANSQKAVYSQIQSDSIKHNNFTLLNGGQKEIVGFKVQGYEPLSLRVLKAVDKLKHLAEKKRLLYVALTRAEHDVVISARLDENSKKEITLREDSYLHLMAKALSTPDKEGDLDTKKMKTELFTMAGPFEYITDLHDVDKPKVKEEIKEIDYDFKPIVFETKEKQKSATGDKGEIAIDTKAVYLGTTVHKLIELHWKTLKKGNYDQLLLKENIDDEVDQEKVSKALDNFLDSDVYQELKSGVKSYFELPFDDGEKRGFIDLIYFNEIKNGWIVIDFKTGVENSQAKEKYQSQLDFYQSFLNSQNIKCVDARLLWL